MTEKLQKRTLSAQTKLYDEWATAHVHCDLFGEATFMLWEVCIRYPNGQERALRSYKDREIALKRIDAIYSEGYPLHVAYIVRPAQEIAFGGQLAVASI
ncbi:MAG: hypothetical protein ACAF41_10550 [Leptolyngbya sp. BL-A-14]